MKIYTEGNTRTRNPQRNNERFAVSVQPYIPACLQGIRVGDASEGGGGGSFSLTFRYYIRTLLCVCVGCLKGL